MKARQRQPWRKRRQRLLGDSILAAASSCAAVQAAEEHARALAAAIHAGDARVAAALSTQLPPTQPELPELTPDEVIHIERAAIAEFVLGLKSQSWRHWTQHQIARLQATQLSRMLGNRRTRFLKAVAAMVQMVSHGVAQGGFVRMTVDGPAMHAAGAKSKLLNDCADMKTLVGAVPHAVQANWPADLAADTCNGVSRDDVMVLVKTALQWSFTGPGSRDAAPAFNPVHRCLAPLATVTRGGFDGTLAPTVSTSSLKSCHISCRRFCSTTQLLPSGARPSDWMGRASATPRICTWRRCRTWAESGGVLGGVWRSLTLRRMTSCSKYSGNVGDRRALTFGVETFLCSSPAQPCSASEDALPSGMCRCCEGLV